MWFHKQITLTAKPRGFHLVTDEILKQIPELSNFSIGLMHVFLQHTSASITINENADPSVRQDFESYFNKTAAENEPYYVHTYEGSDDMPAHLKSSLLGCELSIPISDGQLAVGMWQGIYLGEHRNHGGQRHMVITIQGE